MQDFSKGLLGVSFGILLLSVPVVGNIAHHQEVQLSHYQSTNTQLMNTIDRLKHSNLVNVTKINVGEDDQTIKRNGEAVGSAEITMAKGALDNNFKQSSDYQKAQTTVAALVSNTQSWDPATFPWLDEQGLKCQFIFGPLTSNHHREVAWVFTNDQNQPQYVATGVWNGDNNTPNAFGNIALYDATGGGLEGITPKNKPNTTGASSNNNSQKGMSTSNGTGSSQK